MKGLYRNSETAEVQGVCTKTIRQWDKERKIRCMRMVGGHRRISILEIRRIQGQSVWNSDNNKPNRVAIYCRVSSHEQKLKGDLECQVESVRRYCEHHSYPIEATFKDVGSDLNTKRKGLKKLCKMVEQGMITRIVITYRDRLTRFGLDYLGRYFGSYGVEIISVNQCKQVSMQE